MLFRSGFYEKEMAYRALMGYPPAGHMLAVLVLSYEEERGRQLAGYLAQEGIRQAGKMGCVQIIGPSPASIARIGDQYRMVFYAKSGQGKALIRLRDRLEAVWEACRSRTETVQFDFDPMNSY